MPPCVSSQRPLNAQAEARATGPDTYTEKKPVLWPVASSALILIQASSAAMCSGKVAVL
jgi:hypothetical protein